MAEVDSALQFLGDIGAPTGNWIMCYPYSQYNDSLLRIVKDRGGTYGFTSDVRVADLSTDKPLELPRLDTMDLPA